MSEELKDAEIGTEEKEVKKEKSKTQASDAELTEKIIQLVKGGESLCKPISAKLGVTKGIARRILEKLVAEGTLVKKQEGNKYSYMAK